MKAPRSSGLREVIRLPSSTTFSSTQLAPALIRSVRTEDHSWSCPSRRRPRSAAADRGTRRRPEVLVNSSRASTVSQPSYSRSRHARARGSRVSSAARRSRRAKRHLLVRCLRVSARTPAGPTAPRLAIEPSTARSPWRRARWGFTPFPRAIQYPAIASVPGPETEHLLVVHCRIVEHVLVVAQRTFLVFFMEKTRKVSNEYGSSSDPYRSIGILSGL